MIFVQIAAYRDPELLPTILDCLSKAKYPKDLRFGICWQKDGTDHSLDEFKSDRRFRIEEIAWEKSKGLCWARSRIQRLYRGESFTLQIDSHHRFAEHWDETLRNYMELCGGERPIITAYAGQYDPSTNRKKNVDPYKMVADKFTPSGTILFRPHNIKGWQDLNKPIPARFVSGHFFFTVGRHCREYHYDPNLYFAGDEISLSIRSFTLGYDLYHPHRTVVWHEYTRQGRTKHWDDHSDANKHLVELTWHERDVVSKKRLRKLLKEEVNDEDLGIYGLGTSRTHQDYERYAGIDFGRRRLHRETLQGIDPPCSNSESEPWENCFAVEYALKLKWRLHDIERCDDYNFMYFGVEDNAGRVLFRYDAPPESVECRLMADEKVIRFNAFAKPAKLIVWPVSRSRGWLRKIVYPL